MFVLSSQLSESARSFGTKFRHVACMCFQGLVADSVADCVVGNKLDMCESFGHACLCVDHSYLC